MSMRITFVISSMEAGGAQRVMADMANYWALRGWPVSIITLTGQEVPDFYALHPAVVRIPLALAGDTRSLLHKLGRNVLTLWRLRQEMMAARTDAVISFLDVTNVLTLIATRGLGIRVLVSERINPAANPEIGLVWQALRRRVYPWADVVVAQTAAASRWIETICQGRAVAIPNPLRAMPYSEASRGRFILSVGRLVPQKGFDLLLEAFARIAVDCPDWHVVILGDGPQRQSLMSQAHALGIGKRVRMPGVVENPEHWMAQAGLVVQASRYEGFPNVVMEAMAMGAAVISCDCPSGPSDLIEDGVNGRLTPVDDVAGLASAMMNLIMDPAECHRLGQSARQVRVLFSQSRILSCWEALLCPSLVAESDHNGNVNH